jgi:hypothetical protein
VATADEAEAAWPALSAVAGGVVGRARWLVRVGARVEAEAEFVAFMSRANPPVSPGDVIEAARYALDEGDLDDAEALVKKAVALLRGAPAGPVLEQLLGEREALSRRIQAAQPEIHALLGTGVDAGTERR